MNEQIYKIIAKANHSDLPESGSWLVDDAWVKNQYQWINNIHLVREIYSDGSPVSEGLGEGWVVCMGCAEEEEI